MLLNKTILVLIVLTCALRVGGKFKLVFLGGLGVLAVRFVYVLYSAFIVT